MNEAFNTVIFTRQATHYTNDTNLKKILHAHVEKRAPLSQGPTITQHQQSPPHAWLLLAAIAQILTLYLAKNITTVICIVQHYCETFGNPDLLYWIILVYSLDSNAFGKISSENNLKKAPPWILHFKKRLVYVITWHYYWLPLLLWQGAVTKAMSMPGC